MPAPGEDATTQVAQVSVPDPVMVPPASGAVVAMLVTVPGCPATVMLVAERVSVMFDPATIFCSVTSATQFVAEFGST